MTQKYFVQVSHRGDVYWYRDPEMKILHRLDGPAIEYLNLARFWYQNGVSHRVGGPAEEYHDGHREWHQNGKRHRLDGPAVERPDGRKEYWIEGKRVLARQFTKLAGEFTQRGLHEKTKAELEAALGHPVKIIK